MTLRVGGQHFLLTVIWNGTQVIFAQALELVLCAVEFPSLICWCLKGSVSQNFYTLAFPINQALTYILFVYLLRPTQIVSLNLYFAYIFSICQLAACLLLTIKYDFKQLSFLMYRIHQI